MFGELRSVLAEPGLDRTRWHAWLADESWTLEQMHEQEIYSVRQMQQRHDMRIFSVPDDVILAMMQRKPLPGIYMRQPERLWLCAHLELKPDMHIEVSWGAATKPTLIEVFDELGLKRLHVMTLYMAGLRQCSSGLEHEVLAHPSCEALKEFALWGDHDRHRPLNEHIQISERWIDALTSASTSRNLVRLRMRQSGLFGEHLGRMIQSPLWGRLEALDLSYNEFDQGALHQLVTMPSDSLRELIMFGYEEQVTSTYWSAVRRALPGLRSVSSSHHDLDPDLRGEEHVVMPAYHARARLLLMGLANQGPQQHLCEGDVITLGRDVQLSQSARQGLRILDPSVSRRHTRLIHYQGMYYVMDLHSTNGSYIEEVMTPQGKPVRVKAGQNISVGAAIVRVEA